MGAHGTHADDDEVRVRPLLAALLSALAVAALIGASSSRSAARACNAGSRSGEYSYAGHQATHRGHGVRATITLTQQPSVGAGHVAGWVGVGGPGQGLNGEDAWIQAGIATLPQMDPVIYAEIERGGPTPEFRLIEGGVPVGRSHSSQSSRWPAAPAGGASGWTGKW